MTDNNEGLMQTPDIPDSEMDAIMDEIIIEDTTLTTEQKLSAITIKSPTSSNVSSFDTNISPEMRKDRWENRRAMAWIALWSIIASMIIIFMFASFGLINLSLIQGLTGIIIAFFSIMGTVLAAYFGTTTYYQIKGGQ